MAVVSRTRCVDDSFRACQGSILQVGRHMTHTPSLKVSSKKGGDASNVSRLGILRGGSLSVVAIEFGF